MNYLSLTNKFLIETGVSNEVTTLTDASDDIVQAAHWIDSAWASFQRSRQWPFRRAEGSIDVTAGKTAYTFANLGLEVGDIITPHSFYNSAGSIEQLSYIRLRELRRAPANLDTSRVSKVAVRSGELNTYPDVATTQTVAFDYLKGVQTLTGDDAVPYGLTADFHMLIVHAAVAKYGVSAGGDEGILLYRHHAQEFKTMRQDYQLYAGIDGEEDMPPTRNTLL